jgi:nucleotide-binding universal stress UspA family protein
MRLDVTAITFGARNQATKGGSMINIDKILVPVDFSDCSKVALEYAIHFGQRLEATTIDVLHVWRLSRFVDPESKVLSQEGKEQTLADFAGSAAGRTMQDFLTEVEEAGTFEVRGRLESGIPPQTILQVSAAESYDLIIMGTHGETTDDKLGSITQKVVRNAACPVLTIRGPGARAEG